MTVDQSGWKKLIESPSSSLSVSASDAIEKLLKEYSFSTVLDIGCGPGTHAKLFRDGGKEVTTISEKAIDGFVPDYLGRFEDFTTSDSYDLIWASHVLEHTLSPVLFLRKIFDLARDNDIVAITVPPLKHNIVSGHINLYNIGLLLYQMICAGFDCSQCAYKVYGYNISIIVRKNATEIPFVQSPLPFVECRKYFPFPLSLGGFDGRSPIECNW